jgi:Ni2+-binding GTPase involved in maturation of urease and hydrogenase
MSTIRFIMIGGFLGAGKTTTMGRLARAYSRRGQRVGLVTNDQAQDLVDTHSLREQGFAVEEVAGACFCCKFDDLLEKVGSLEASERPNVILAEPVGSCTDLVATVVQPLKDLYGARFSVAPYPVLFKPSHGLKILKNEPGAGFSPKAAYIFRKQLEEADAIVLNRLDEMSPAEVEELSGLIAKEYPGVPLVRMSAKTGQGFDGLVTLLEQEGRFGQKILDIDYDIYAEGEAELGWLNSSVRVEAPGEFELDRLLLDVVIRLQQTLAPAGAEVAHLKAIGLWEGFFGVANLVASRGKAELSQPSHCKTCEADIIVNARVAMDPAELQRRVLAVLRDATTPLGATLGADKTQSFRPGRPTPTHRYAAAKN